MARGLNYGIEALEEVLSSDTDLANDFILYKSKYNDLMHLSSLNTLPYSEIELGMDRLRQGLLQLVDRLEPDHLVQAEVKTDLTNKALPHRRTNFFRLIDLHFRNLQDIYYLTQVYNAEKQLYETERYAGRDAVFRTIRMIKRNYLGEYEEEDDSQYTMRAYFKEFFQNEEGILEVYLKNVQHLLAYSRETEEDQRFFLDTLRSLLSRSELVLLFYHTAVTEQAEQRQLVVDAPLWDESLAQYLIRPQHFEWF